MSPLSFLRRAKTVKKTTILPPDEPILVSKPSFNIRFGGPNDAKFISSLLEVYMQKSPRSLETHSAPPEKTKFFQNVLGTADTPGIVYLVAISNDKKVNYGVEGGFLAFIIVIPHTDSMKRLAGVRCGRMHYVALGDDVLGTEMYHDMTATLLEKTLEVCREREKCWKSLVTTSGFREDRPGLVAHRDLMAKNGFEQMGMLKDIFEKDGVLFNQLFMQRTV